MDIANIQIILVEDNPFDAKLTLLALAEQGLDKNVVHLRDGEEALAYFFNDEQFSNKKFSNNKTAIVLLDIRMPKVDGIEVLQKLKKGAETQNIPVVVLTSAEDDPIVQKCEELGADDYIVKPITLEGYSKVVASLSRFWA